MTLAFISVVAILAGLALVFGLGFASLYFLWALFQPPEGPGESSG